MDNRLKKAIELQDQIGEYIDQAYLESIERINEQADEILKEDLGSEFVKNCGRDIAGEVVRTCFDTSDFHLTVDQLARRILHFSYNDEYDPLGQQSEQQKNVYNYNDISSTTLNYITEDIEKHTVPLFEIERSKDYSDASGRKKYRESQRDENGDLYDEITGQKGEDKTIIKNGKEEQRSDLQADHIQARQSAKYNSKYITEKGVEKLRDFYNSADNMQIMHASANTSKGDIRVCKDSNGNIFYKNTKESDYDPKTDITDKASPKQLADAVCSQWEKDGEPNKIEKLKEKGYLNEDGKVPKSVRKKIENNYRNSQNKESKVILKNTDYNKVTKDAVKQTSASIGKIIAGQVIYYAAPPLIYEIKWILKEKKDSLDEALEKLRESAHRIGNYIFHHLKDIFKNVVENSLKKFIKTFMDILINMVKATVKKLLKIAKNIVMAVVDSINTLATPGLSRAEKADAIFNLFGITITNTALEIIFELIKEGGHIPEFLLTPIQILTSVVCTNFVMLILNKADLFNTRVGFKIRRLEELFENEREDYHRRIDDFSKQQNLETDKLLEEVKQDCEEICDRLRTFDIHNEYIRPELEKIADIFNIDVSFESAWQKYLTA